VFKNIVAPIKNMADNGTSFLNRKFLMSRTFAYVRVSTLDQTTENQVQEITSAGFHVEPQRIISETISGSVQAAKRPGFAKLVDRLEFGDVLIVSKMDRLGRDAIDVAQTVDGLAKAGVRVHCLALGGVDLTSPAGRMTMHVINAVAQFERDLIIERTQAGLARAKSKGTRLGRPVVISEAKEPEIMAALDAGESVSSLARKLGVSRMSIMRRRRRGLGD